MRPVAVAARVVEVIADYGSAARPRYRYGSGCIVVGRTVLTAAHVVAGAHAVQVRDAHKVLRAATVDERLVGDEDGPGPDLALIELDEPAVELPAMPLAVVDRGSAEAEPVERCHAVGYPWFAERSSPTAVRDTADAVGHIPVLSKLATGLLSLQVSTAPRPLPPQADSLAESEWSGMSGAPVIAAGWLLGVVTEHAPREGPSAITVTPVSAIEADPAHPGWGPGVADPLAWWAKLGISALSELRRLPCSRERSEHTYQATLRDIRSRTSELLSREHELAEISSFATGSEGYRWLVGGAWAGKTALLAATVTASLPEQVDVIAYFMSRRGSDADSNRFLAAVVRQLAELLDEDPTVADAHQFRALWQWASEAAEASRRHLLLVVDGLDEDLRPPGSPSVAALLPAVAGGRVHVLVGSRPYPELPVDIPVGHPLLTSPRIELKPFEGAAELAALARQEIDDLKRRDDAGLAVDVLGVLTAAAGPLTVDDLATLTTHSSASPSTHARRVRRLVTEQAARSLQEVGPALSGRYQFAHGSLLEYAQTDEDLRHPEYRQRIHNWAENWCSAGWTAEDGAVTTPSYLLESYPISLASDAKNPSGSSAGNRLAELVGDFGWLDAAVSRIGVDSVLASVRTAAGLRPTPTVTTILRLLQLQAVVLRLPRPASQPGSTVATLAWGALQIEAEDVRHAASERLRRYPAPQLIPISTNHHTSPFLVSQVGDQYRLVSAVAVTAGGGVVSGAQDGVVRLWDDPEAPGVLGRELGRHDRWVTTLAGMIDGRVVSGGSEGTVMLWDPAVPSDPGRELGRHRGQVDAVAAMMDGRVVSGGSEGTVMLWDPAVPSDPGRELGRHQAAVQALAVTADGRVVSGGSEGAVRLWDPACPGDTGRELGRHPKAVQTVAVLADGRVVSGGYKNALRLWDPAVPGDPGRELAGRHYDVMAVAATDDGRVVSGEVHGLLRLWDPTRPDHGGSELRHDGFAVTMAVTGNDCVASGWTDGAVRLWDPAQRGDPGRELGRHTLSHGALMANVRAVAAVTDGRVVSGGADGAVRLWDPALPHDPGRQIGRHEGGAMAVAAMTDGRMVSGGADWAVTLWDPDIPGDLGRKIGRHESTVHAVAVTADGRVVSGGADGTIRLWDPTRPGGRELGRHEGAAFSVAAMADGRIVSGGADCAVRLWDLTLPGDPSREIGRHQGVVSGLAVTADGRVISGGGRTLCLWDPTVPGDSGRELVISDEGVAAVGVSTGGDVVILTGWGTITVLQMTTAGS